MASEFGACRYCGQIISVSDFLKQHKDIEDPDEDKAATLLCDCKEALRDRESYEAAIRGETERYEAMTKAEDTINQLFAGDRATKRTGLDEDERDTLLHITERTYDGFIEKATLVFTSGIKATIKIAGNGLKIERSETKKEAAKI